MQTSNEIKYWPVIFGTDNVKATLKGDKKDFRIVIMNPKNNEQPPYQIGDILFIMEKCVLTYGPGVPNEWHYRADKGSEEGYNWYSSNRMPKQAARLFLEVKNIYSEDFHGEFSWVIVFERIEKPKNF